MAAKKRAKKVVKDPVVGTRRYIPASALECDSVHMSEKELAEWLGDNSSDSIDYVDKVDVYEVTITKRKIARKAGVTISDE